MQTAEVDSIEELLEREKIQPLRIRPSVRDAIEVLRAVHKGNFWGLAIASTIVGVLPSLFMLAVASVVASVPAAVQSGGMHTPEGKHFLTMLCITGVAYVAQNVPGPFIQAYTEGFRARVNAHRRERAMRATVAIPGLRHLEDAEYMDALRLATMRDWPDPGSFAVGFFGLITQRVTGFAAAVVVGLQFNWFVAIALVIVWIVAGVQLRRGQALGYAAGRAGIRRSDYFRNLAMDGAAAKEIRVFGLRNWLLDQFSEAWTSVMRDVWRARGVSTVRIALMVIVVVAVNAFSFYLLIDAARKGDVGIGQLTAAAQGLLSLGFIGMTSDATLAVSLGSAAFPAILELERQAQRGSDFSMSGDDSPQNMPVKEVVFENVSFKYPGTDKAIYKNLNLRIEAGKSLGIVGNNGAGKTTLIKLLARFYDPDSGRILVDGRDLRTIDPVRWQRRVAAIFQDFVHFEYSAADNVRFGNLGLSKQLQSEHGNDNAVLERVTELVGARDFVEKLPGKWETPLSRRFEGGVDVSGGQWQRLALARALYAVEGGAGILVLDEPTANLDARSEVLLFDRFLEVTKGATSVLISHRFSTVRRADRIVVIENGEVVEEGTHDQLTAIPQGRYAHAFSLQAERYNDDAELDLNSELREDSEIEGAHND